MRNLIITGLIAACMFGLTSLAYAFGNDCCCGRNRDSVLDAALQAEQIGREKNQDLVNSILGAMDTITDINKTKRLKEANQMLFDLGGMSKENLGIVVKRYNLSPREMRELITAWQGLE